MKRYSDLSPLTIYEQESLAILAMKFFGPLQNKEIRKILGLSIDDTQLKPLSIGDFFDWYKAVNNEDISKKQQRICELFSLLENRKYLVNAGVGRGGPPFNACYYCMIELTNIERKGWLFLGKYLGLEFIANKVKHNLVHITGVTENKDLHGGSGILITPQIILTCRHVLNDMKLDEHVNIDGTKHKIKDQESHEYIDFGVIILEAPVTQYFCQDIALRKATLLEKIIIAGFPKIPRKLCSSPIIQSGEISGRIEAYLENKNHPIELFTSIARPGNSGGPVMSEDGKLLGLVVNNLEREQEDTDNNQSILPCFAAIPSDVIFNSFNELKIAEKGYSIPWEDYQ